VATVRRDRGWRSLASTVRAIAVPAAAAARIYAMNLTTWRDDPHIQERYRPDQLDDLARDLAGLARSTSNEQITWGVRQVAYERDPSPPARA
jgi:hypothetical protein